MKILFVSSSSGSRGGGELYLITLAEAVSRRGHQVLLWVSTHPRMDELAARFAAFGKVIRSDYTNTYDHRARSLATCWNFSTSKRVAREWLNIKPDVIHVNKQNLEDGLDLLRAAKMTSIPSVCTIHLTQSARYLGAMGAGLRDFAAIRALKKYRGIFIAIQEKRARELETLIAGSARVISINNGVPLPDPAASRLASRTGTLKSLDYDASHFLIAGLGRMVKQKRPMLFLEKAREILVAMPEARFVWIGDGPLVEAWDAFVADNGLQPFVKRLAWQADPASFLASADLFMHVAEYEGLPLALLEAMAMKLPCAITENLFDDMPFLQQPEACTVPIRDGWIATLRDRSFLEAVATAGRKVVEEHCSIPKVAAEYERLYECVSQ